MDECTRELADLGAVSGFSPPFAIDRLEAVANPDSPLRFDPRIRQPGAVWLVLWGAAVPQTASMASSTSPFELHHFDRLDPTTVLKVATGPSLVANLGHSLAHLPHLDPTTPARFDYYRRQAEILAFQGNLIKAQASLNTAWRVAGDDPAALATVALTAGHLTGQAGPDQPIKTKTIVDFGRPPALRLIGYSVPARLQANQTVPISLAWQVRTPLPADYSIFLHLRSVDGQNVAQLDFPPFDDTYPTSRWVAGTEIKETRFWTLPPELPAGAYSLYLGLYQVESLARLPLVDDQNGENAVRLADLVVEAASQTVDCNRCQAR
jgi:hypothetical protein